MFYRARVGSNFQRQLRFDLVIVVGIFLCAGAGCAPTPPDTPSGEPNAEAQATKASPLEEAKPEATSTKHFNLHAQIAARRERLRALPGRTGLLNEERLYSVFDEEVIIRDFFQDRRDGVFVDVGCAWPIQGSNTYYLEHHLGWTGIGIDALSDYASQWKEKRPGAKFVNFLVSDQPSGTAEFYRSENLGLSSAEKGRADGQHFGGTLAVEKIEVPAATLSEILDAQGITHIDLLSLDIEGFELQALRGLDFDRFQPELIVSEGERPKVEALLARQGYERIERYVPFDETNRYYRKRTAAAPPAANGSDAPGNDAAGNDG